MAIDNENLGMVELLINFNVDTKDALLHAISEEFVEAVEMLLDHEDGNGTKDGQHVSEICQFIDWFEIAFIYWFSLFTPNHNNWYIKSFRLILLLFCLHARGHNN